MGQQILGYFSHMSDISAVAIAFDEVLKVRKYTHLKDADFVW